MLHLFCDVESYTFCDIMMKRPKVTLPISSIRQKKDWHHQMNQCDDFDRQKGICRIGGRYTLGLSVAWKRKEDLCFKQDPE